MNVNDIGWRIAVLLGVVLASAACSPANTEVGSACRDGVCPGALSKQGPVCSAGQVSAELAVTSAPVICLPRPLPKDDHGKVPCQVRWLTRDSCPDSPSLSPARDGRSCLIHQVSASSLDASMDEGWYYDDDYHECPDAPVAIRITEGVLPPHAAVRMDCDTLWVADPDAAEADAGSLSGAASECVLPKDSARHSSSVGDSCMPKLVPQGGFHEHELYVESGAGQCGTGACLVYHLSGDPRPECDPQSKSAPPRYCAAPSEVEERVYCSLRCTDDTHCGDGFTCDAEALSNGPAGLRGGYCIRVPK